MARIESPDLLQAGNMLADFTPVREEHSAGINFAVLEHDSGVQLHLTQEGQNAAEHMAGFAQLIGSMTTYIAAHGDYTFEKDSERIAERMNAVQIVNNRHTSGSIYSPFDLPNTIVKAYQDKGNHNAPLQFRAMTWLHRQLIQSEESCDDLSLGVPAQYAMITSPATNRRTVVMERAPGAPLQQLSHDYDRFLSEKNKLNSRNLTRRVSIALGQRLGRGAGLVNDITFHSNQSNLIVDGDPFSSTPKISIIDQPDTPEVFSRARARLLLASLR